MSAFLRVPGVWRRAALAVACGCLAVASAGVRAQGPIVKYGDPVPRDVREMYDAGIRYLLRTQNTSGGWQDGQSGPGVTGLALMVLLASGEDPNFGFYREPIRKALRSMLAEQDPNTGFFGGNSGHGSMYQHGFAMLALAEAYGSVDDRDLWVGDRDAAQRSGRRSIGQALELAVRCAVTSAKQNPLGAWRYGPDAKDADTSVSGAVMMGLLAARNAGIEVPDETLSRASKYFLSMINPAGQAGYSGSAGGGSDAVTSIAVLVLSIARQRDAPQFKKAAQYLKGQSRRQSAMESYPAYTRYYRAQALFQADVEAWEKWNVGLVRELKAMQGKDGSFTGFADRGGGQGGTVDTSLTLLALAVNFKFLPIYER